MAQQNLSESLDRQRRFVADASHELRGPLTTIRSNAGFLLDRADAAPNDRDDAIADIGAEADRMAALVDDLLILASVDAGRPLDRYPVDLAGVVGELERRAGHLDRNIRFHLGSPAVVAGDRAALARLTWILIDNAVRHGGGAVDVSVTADAAEVDLRVTDEGDGFPPDELGRIFDRFYRADAARSPAGAGLGLAIAREIAEAHGGSLTAANGSDGGAVLTATFPAA
jgi:signal transduction histidine kinase